MEDGEIDGNKVTLDWGVKVALAAEVEAEVAEVDLLAEAGEALEGEKASEEAEEEEEETTSHKERRRSLNSFFYPCLSLFHLKERTLGFLLCYLINDRAF